MNAPWLRFPEVQMEPGIFCDSNQVREVRNTSGRIFRSIEEDSRVIGAILPMTRSYLEEKCRMPLRTGPQINRAYYWYIDKSGINLASEEIVGAPLIIKLQKLAEWFLLSPDINQLIDVSHADRLYWNM